MTTFATRMPVNTKLRDIVSAVEWETRVKLAACYRMMAHAGIADLTYNHLSARIPDRPDRYLIKGEHELFEEVTASSLLAYDMDGNRVYDAADAVSTGGLVIHGGVMEKRPDIMAVFHTHTPANMAVSAQECGLLPISQHAFLVYNTLGYHDFAGFEFDLAGRRRLVRDLEGKLTLIMRNHGVLSCGRSISEAYVRHHFLELACQGQIGALAAGGVAGLTMPPAEMIAHASKQAERLTGKSDDEQRDWSALMRSAERLDPTFRD
jgi:ribulose-5-phosphate 4-epimerase/fuculose-1-phosphate aldolase